MKTFKYNLELNEDNINDKYTLKRITVNSFNDFANVISGLSKVDMDNLEKVYKNKYVILRGDSKEYGYTVKSLTGSKFEIYPVLIGDDGYISDWSYERSTKLGAGVMVSPWYFFQRMSDSESAIKDAERHLKVVWNRAPKLHAWVQKRNSRLSESNLNIMTFREFLESKALEEMPNDFRETRYKL